MNKKLICGLLSATVLAGTSPITVFATDEPLSQLNDGIDLRNQETDIPDTGMGWEWDADDLMLTLNGF
ncbi:MAG: hypothetical protein IJ969_07075, partial [Anaerotignum sp.]|nr:hypothetical protein [Anaerotignum sp.]